MDIKVYPNSLAGNVVIPPSKSLTHRALICASLAPFESVIENPLYSDDTMATIDCLRQLGVDIVTEEAHVIVRGVKKYQLNGCLNVGESASTLRFLLPIISLFCDDFKMYGSKRLMERINTKDLDTLLGLEIVVHEDHVSVKGKLASGDFHPSDAITTQIISGLCFVLPLLHARIHIENATNPYVVMTMDMMRRFGITLEYKDKYFFHLKGHYQGARIRIESDFSSAASFIAMMVFNHGIHIDQLTFTSFQGDMAMIEYVKKMGAELIISNHSLRCIGKDLHGTNFNVHLTPDLMPVLAAMAAVIKGKTEIYGLDKLKYKESDRSLAICQALKALGANINRLEDKIIIEGKEKLTGGCKVYAFDDHRIVMALVAIASQVEKPFIITKGEVIGKSFPNFWELFRQIGGHYDSQI